MLHRTHTKPHTEAPRAGADGALEAQSSTFFDELAISVQDRQMAPRGRGLDVARLLVVLVCLALVSTNAWLMFVARADVVANAAQSSTNLARAVVERVEGLISETDHVLGGVLFELERADMTPDTLLHLQPTLVRHVAESEQIRGLFVFDAQGRWVANSEALLTSQLNSAQRPYFTYHRDNPSAMARIGTPIVSQSSGEWIVPISRRINDPDGAFAGVVLGTLRVEYLLRLLERFDVGSEGAISMRVPDGLLVRRPYAEADLARPMAPSPLKTLFETTPGGTTDARSTLDGVQRLISFEHARNYPLLVTVAKSKREVLAHWRRTSYGQTAWACFLCLVLAFAGHYARVSLRRRQAAEERLLATSDALSLANARLAKLARYDGLTGLPNRRQFDKQFVRAFLQAQRERSPIAVVMIDVDEFKKYNDHFGHVEGDVCLQRVAAALRAVVRRPHDLIARYGGEEMVLLLPATDAAGAMRLAEAARLAVFALQIPHETAQHGVVSISLGIAVRTPGAADTADALLKAADAALYEAKQRGRNQVCMRDAA